VSGHEGWSEVSLGNIRDVDVNFSMVSYNPIRQNPSVLSETLLKLFPILAQDQNINKRALLEELVTGVGLSTKLLVPREEVEAQEQAAQQMMMAQMMGAAGGGAPGAGGPPPGAEGGMPPGAPPAEVPSVGATEAATQNVPSEVMAAMGPTPVPVA